MSILRAFIYYSLLCASLAWICTVGNIMLYTTEPLGITNRRNRIHWIQSFNRWMIKIVAPLVLKLHYRVHGQHRIKEIEKTPSIFMMKHQSEWETVASPNFLPMHTWVAKRELLWIPFFGWGLSLTDPITIVRNDPIKALKIIVREGRERLKAGLSIVVFPEGTRLPPGISTPFKPGAAFLAKKCGAPIVPIAHNAGSFWGKSRFIKPGTITVVIGKPFNPKGMTTEQINTRVENWMRRVMAVLEKDL